MSAPAGPAPGGSPLWCSLVPATAWSPSASGPAPSPSIVSSAAVDGLQLRLKLAIPIPRAQVAGPFLLHPSFFASPIDTLKRFATSSLVPSFASFGVKILSRVHRYEIRYSLFINVLSSGCNFIRNALYGRASGAITRDPIAVCPSLSSSKDVRSTGAFACMSFRVLLRWMFHLHAHYPLAGLGGTSS